MLDLTVIILTKNEEKNIEKCIKSFKNIAKRFVIVDSYSNDKTKEISLNLAKEKYIIDFFEHEFNSHSSQMNWAINNTNISTKWVMRIDADEELTEELVQELLEKIPNIDDSVNGIILKRRMYFMGKWIRHGGRYPELALRIWRNGYGICEDKLMDEHMVIIGGSTVTLKKDFIDYNTKSLEWWISKHNWYSSLEMQNHINDLKKSVTNASFGSKQAIFKTSVKNNGYYKLPSFFRAHLYFIYRYYLRLGFLDGNEGRIYHFLQAYWYRFLVDAKLYESERNGENNAQVNSFNL